MENAEVRVTNDESKEEKAEGFVYHKVDLGPVPVIDYGEVRAETRLSGSVLL